MSETTTTASGSAEASETESQGRYRLLLSGGGHRASMGCTGAILYLIMTGRWRRVSEVVSVSGGSFPNAALLSTRAYDDDDDDESALEALRELLTRVIADGVRPWRSGRRMGNSLMIGGLPLMALLAVPLAVSASTSLVNIPLFQYALGAGLGAVARLVSGAAIRRGLGGYLRDYVGTITSGTQRMDSRPTSNRQHVLCASGFASAEPYYLWSGGEFFYSGGDLSAEPSPQEPSAMWGVPMQSQFDIADAAYASASLPGVGRLTAPVAGESVVPAPVPGERLIDGGVSGIFGQQIAVRIREGAVANEDTQRALTIAVDGGRHLQKSSKLSRMVGSTSITGMLFRWLQLSLDATHRNDLVDLQGAALVRLSEEQLEKSKARAELMARLGELKAETAKLSLTNLNRAKALNAVTTGFVGTCLTLDPYTPRDELERGLLRGGEMLGVGHEMMLTWDPAWTVDLTETDGSAEEGLSQTPGIKGSAVRS